MTDDEGLDMADRTARDIMTPDPVTVDHRDAA